MTVDVGRGAFAGQNADGRSRRPQTPETAGPVHPYRGGLTGASAVRWLTHRAQDARRVTDDDGAGRHIPSDHRTGPHHRVLANPDAGQEYCAGPDAGPVLEHGGQALE